MKRIFVFGNPYIEQDTMALRVAKYLDAYEITYCRSPEDLIGENPITIVDVVKNTDRVIDIQSVAALKSNSVMSLHDFDVAHMLQLLQALDPEISIRIVGVPPIGDEQEIAKQVGALL